MSYVKLHRPSIEHDIIIVYLFSLQFFFDKQNRENTPERCYDPKTLKVHVKSPPGDGERVKGYLLSNLSPSSLPSHLLPTQRVNFFLFLFKFSCECSCVCSNCHTSTARAIAHFRK